LPSIKWRDLPAGILDWGLDHMPRILLTLVLALILLRAGRRLLNRFETRLNAQDARTDRHLNRSATLISILGHVLSITVWTIALLQVLGEIGIALGPMIAGAGLVGVALGFGAQSLVRDFLTGFFVILEDQYSVGDRVDIDGVAGTVERFSLRLTSVRSIDGTLHHISNGNIKIASNTSAGWSRAIIDVGVPHSENLKKVKEALLRAGSILAADEQVGPLVQETPDIMGVEEFTESQMKIRVAIKTIPGRQRPVARAYRRYIKEVFDEEGIEMDSSTTLVMQPSVPTTSSSSHDEDGVLAREESE
jgi:moderate conductance mechanosensitive channel